MRKKMNIQKTDYSENGELLCFGLSEHALSEMLPKFSEKAQKDISLVANWFKNREDIAIRPAHKSDWTLTKDQNRS